MIPRATYRIQFRAGFAFADAEAIVPYLHNLGVSHIYASPLAESRSRSAHGYDVTDPTRIRGELGGEDGLARLVETLRAHGMGLILDIVPNHVAAHPDNPWWADVLRHGRDSRFAHFFDVDWTRQDGRLLLPVLGDPLDEVIAAGQAELVEQDGAPALRLYGEQCYPLAPGSVREGDLAATLEAQHYKLAWWRLGHDELNWRRFFSISELAGLRIEDDEVFEAVHALPLRLYRERLIDGLRIDHVDGLSDPAAYLAKLRARLDALDVEREGEDGGGPAWLVVEKILGPSEDLPRDWPVDGTTGYEFMDQVSLLLHEAPAEELLTRHWAELSARPAEFEAEEELARRQMLHWEFSAQLAACVHALAELAARSPATARWSRAAWARAVETLVVLFPVYRTYGTGSAAPASDAAVRAQVAARLDAAAPPGEADLSRAILAWLAGEGPAAEEAGEFVRKFQQLSAPIAAKAVEDTAFYRYGRLLSRNNVGFQAGRFSAPADVFHQLQSDRARHWPRSMLTTATHDHKRGEDVRARLLALTAAPHEWVAASREWMARMPGAGDIWPGDLYMLLQVVLGAWPDRTGPADGERLAAYAGRLELYAAKALREAKLRSSWAAPDEAYEAKVNDAIEALLCSSEALELRQDIVAFRDRLAPCERVKSLAQVFLCFTCPGVPDLYQGTELADRSLVDPDNRRPVDYDRRRRLLEDGGSEKQRLIHELLRLRERHPQAFAGAYRAVAVSGEVGDRLLAFTRGDGAERLLMVVALGLRGDGSVPYFGPDSAQGWEGVTVSAPQHIPLDDLITGRANLLAGVGSLPCALWQL